MPTPPSGSTPVNAVVAQSGGPSAVINQSLVGVVEGLRGQRGIGKILGARHGVKGMAKGDFTDLTGVPQEQLDRAAATPSSTLGSTRDKPDQAYCQRVVESLKKHAIRYFFYIGGNDSSDTCRLVAEMAKADGYDLTAYHIPKTIDNDLEKSDHTPGYGSAARYVAMAFMGDSLDNRALPGIKLNVVMGRHAGFLTAASILARQREDDGPHLVYVPEVKFDLDAFVGDVDRVYSRLGRCHVAVSEGIEDKDGVQIGARLIQDADKDAHGNVQLSGSGALGDGLADLLKQRLTPAGGKPPRTRADTFGYAQRYWPDPSPLDSREAREVGRFGAACALKGDAPTGSVAIQRASRPGEAYRASIVRVEIADVAARTRHLPPEFLQGAGQVAPAFADWLRPLVGDLPRVGWL